MNHVLVGRYDSPFVRRAAMALVHHKVGFERRRQSVFDDFEAVLRVHPLGQAPALILPDGMTVLTETSAIIEWVDRIAPWKRRLTTPGSGLFACLQIEAVAVGLAQKAMALNAEANRRSEALRDPGAVARAERQVTGGLAWLDARCAGTGWLVAGQVSRADLALKTALDYLAHKLPGIPVHPGLGAWADAMEAREPLSSVPFEG